MFLVGNLRRRGMSELNAQCAPYWALSRVPVSILVFAASGRGPKRSGTDLAPAWLVQRLTKQGGFLTKQRWLFDESKVIIISY
jgi:hypothetical protein